MPKTAFDTYQTGFSNSWRLIGPKYGLRRDPFSNRKLMAKQNSGKKAGAPGAARIAGAGQFRRPGFSKQRRP